MATLDLNQFLLLKFGLILSLRKQLVFLNHLFNTKCLIKHLKKEYIILTTIDKFLRVYIYNYYLSKNKLCVLNN